MEPAEASGVWVMVTASRRSVLMVLSSASLIGGGGLHAAPVVGEREGLKSLVPAMFSDLEAARTVGRRYLAGGPAAEAAALRLSERLAAGRPAGVRGLRRLLGRLRQEDARQRSFVRIDGWIMPTTEAQICALAVLLDGPA